MTSLARRNSPETGRRVMGNYDREKLQERLAKLARGVAVIKVGAATETAMKEKKARVEDSLNASVRPAEEVVVPGVRCSDGDGLKLEGDEKVEADTAPSRGYNAETIEHVDMLQAGIIDPRRSSGSRCRTRSPLPHSCSRPRR